MATHDYHLVKIAKERGHYYNHVNHIMSCYQEPRYTKGGSSISSDVTVIAASVPQQIAATLSNAETIEDQDGLKNYYAVFNNETGADWSELTLLDDREGLTSFVTWACGINSGDANDDLALLAFKDPLRGIPKTFKDYNGYSPVIVLAIRRPHEGNLADAGDYMKELLSNSTEVEASIARGLIEDIAVPEASEDEDDEASGGEDDETSGDEDDEASGDGDDQDKEVSD